MLASHRRLRQPLPVSRSLAAGGKRARIGRSTSNKKNGAPASGSKLNSASQRLMASNGAMVGAPAPISAAWGRAAAKPTGNHRLPPTRWLSTEVTRQRIRYAPCARPAPALSPTSTSTRRGSSAATCASRRSTRRPSESSTAMALKATSIGSLNRNETTRGGLSAGLTVPAAGVVANRSACALAGVGLKATSSAASAPNRRSPRQRATAFTLLCRKPMYVGAAEAVFLRLCAASPALAEAELLLDLRIGHDAHAGRVDLPLLHVLTRRKQADAFIGQQRFELGIGPLVGHAAEE